jgi:hypothetical protein
MASRFVNTAILGEADVIAAFRKVHPIMQEHFADATIRSAASLLARARAKVPVRFGFLKQALAYEYNEKTGIAMIGIPRGLSFAIPGSKTFSGKSDTAVPSKYGHLVEFGHAGPHPAGPRPFMIPSAEEERDEYLNRCREAGRKAERDLEEVGRIN